MFTVQILSYFLIRKFALYTLQLCFLFCQHSICVNGGMIILFQIFLLFFIGKCHSQNQSSDNFLFDSRVFNHLFYVNANEDLQTSGILSLESAKKHWLDIGSLEGRQACGSFHVRQFLDNYSQLSRQFRTDYTAAIKYYLEIGHEHKMLGYSIGGAYRRYTIGDLKQGTLFSTLKLHSEL